MPAPTAAPGLSPTDVEHIRDTLAAGRKPKVVFTASAGQVAGQTGQVVELTDASASDEWIVVRFGRDELPFCPADLAIPPRGGRRAEAPPPEFKLGGPAKVPRRRESTPGRREPAAIPARRTDAAPARVEAAVRRSGSAEERRARAATSPAGSSPDGSSAAKPAGKNNGRAKAPATLTVTLAYSDRVWTVAASQGGTKALVKPTPLKAVDALRMVALLGVPGVLEAVERIIAAERDAAEDRARRLRAELAEIESRLSELASRG